MVTIMAALAMIMMMLQMHLVSSQDTPDSSMDGSGSCSDAEEISALQLSSQQAMCEWRLGTLGLAGLGCTCCTMRIFQIPGCVDPELQMVHSKSIPVFTMGLVCAC